MAVLRPCRTTAAYEAIPATDRQLDLDVVGHQLEDAGWATVAHARVLLVVRKQLEATVFPSGKVLLKTRDLRTAEQAWREIEPLLGGAEGPDGF